MKMSANDRRVLADVEYACREWDGFIPHGAADWTAIRRLCDAGLLAYVDFAICQTCPSEPHEATAYALTDAGHAALRETV